MSRTDIKEVSRGRMNVEDKTQIYKTLAVTYANRISKYQDEIKKLYFNNLVSSVVGEVDEPFVKDRLEEHHRLLSYIIQSNNGTNYNKTVKKLHYENDRVRRSRRTISRSYTVTLNTENFTVYDYNAITVTPNFPIDEDSEDGGTNGHGTNGANGNNANGPRSRRSIINNYILDIMERFHLFLLIKILFVLFLFEANSKMYFFVSGLFILYNRGFFDFIINNLNLMSNNESIEQVLRRISEARNTNARTEQTEQTGQTGQTEQTDQTGQTGQTDKTGQTEQTGETGQTGQTEQTGETGQTGQTGQTSETGQIVESGQRANNEDNDKLIEQHSSYRKYRRDSEFLSHMCPDCFDPEIDKFHERIENGDPNAKEELRKYEINKNEEMGRKIRQRMKEERMRNNITGPELDYLDEDLKKKRYDKFYVTINEFVDDDFLCIERHIHSSDGKKKIKKTKIISGLSLNNGKQTSSIEIETHDEIKPDDTKNKKENKKEKEKEKEKEKDASNEKKEENKQIENKVTILQEKSVNEKKKGDTEIRKRKVENNSVNNPSINGNEVYNVLNNVNEYIMPDFDLDECTNITGIMEGPDVTYYPPNRRVYHNKKIEVIDKISDDEEEEEDEEKEKEDSNENDQGAEGSNNKKEKKSTEKEVTTETERRKPTKFEKYIYQSVVMFFMTLFPWWVPDMAYLEE